MHDIAEHYDVVLFDLGNTLVRQGNPDVEFDDLALEFMPGALDALDALRGRVRLGIVSNTRTATSHDILRKLGDDAERFDVVIASAEIGVRKPAAEPLLAALDRLGVSPGERVLFVGDNESDEQAARSAGVHFAYAGTDLALRLTGFRGHESALARALRSPFGYSEEHEREVAARFDALAKPQGSLGRLETVTARIAGMEATARPTVDPAAVAVFIADHGIAADDTVTPWPQIVTSIMRDTIVDGRAAVSVLARNADVFVDVTDVGTIPALPSMKARDARIAFGSGDIRSGAVMTREQARAAMEVGAATAERLIAGGTRCLAVGEVGMGNTTSAAAIIAHECGALPEVVTGRGAGIDDDTLARKTRIVADAVAAMPAEADAEEVLARLGGFEIAAMAGCIIGAAAQGVPVILDGVITQAAALVALRACPSVQRFLIASHSSAEPASRFALQQLGLQALLDLDLRLGEGTGAMLALPLLRGACATVTEMATIAELLG